MKIQIKRDEVSKYTKNHLKFKKNLRKMLMQRSENKEIEYVIDKMLDDFPEFDPVLDFDFRPICSCETFGLEEEHFNIKHTKLFKRSGPKLWDELISGYCNEVGLVEGYELWLLEDMRLAFVYTCIFEVPGENVQMVYHYPLGKKIPTKSDLDAETFLEKMTEKIYLTKYAR